MRVRLGEGTGGWLWKRGERARRGGDKGSEREREKVEEGMRASERTRERESEEARARKSEKERNVTASEDESSFCIAMPSAGTSSPRLGQLKLGQT